MAKKSSNKLPVMTDAELQEIRRGAAKMLASAKENMVVFDEMLNLLLTGGRIELVAKIYKQTFNALRKVGATKETAQYLTPQLVALLINKLPTIFV